MTRILETKLGFLLVMFGMHLMLPLTRAGGGVLVPEMILFVIFSVSGLIFTQVHSALIQRFVLLNLILAASILFNLWPGRDYTGYALSVLNLNFSLVIALCLALYLLRMASAVRLERWIRTTLAVFLALSVLEITFPPFEALVDAFRYAVFPEVRIYTADWRDIALYGFPRPTLFGNEPSYLGITTTSLAAVCFILAPTVRAQGIAVLLFLASVVIVRSPTAVALGLVMIYFFAASTQLQTLTSARALLILLSPSVIAFGVFVFVQQFGARFSLFLAGEDNSGDLRLIKPIEAIWVSIETSPLFGTGVGGRDKIVDVMMVVGDWGRHVGSLAYQDPANIFATGTMLIFTEMGLSAVVVLVIILGIFRLSLPLIRPLDFIAVFASVSITMGGWTHPRLWIIISLLLVAIHLRRAALREVLPLIPSRARPPGTRAAAKQLSTTQP
ncbi:MAG: hypothetical protein N4A39_16855 [Roseicyclus sp.]|jgi:hypothetical protein|nr:hypothetical protein [Roseicyclus sp.]